jgi:hypothetical protein
MYGVIPDTWDFRPKPDGGEAQAGQLRAVDDIHVEVQADRLAAETAEGGGNRGRVGCALATLDEVLR